jgi:hypothetical protein
VRWRGDCNSHADLPQPGLREVLYYWEEYTAFLITPLACLIALATLVWALVAVSPKEEVKPSTGAKDKDDG